MAKIMLGSLAGAISGSLGNDVFSHGRYGAYVRRRVIPTKVTNPYTLYFRNIMTICSRAWGGLTAGQQGAWSTWAQAHPITDRLGQKQVLFGAQAYTQLNSRLAVWQDTPVSVPPTIGAPSPLTSLSAILDASAGSAVLTTNPSPVGVNYRLWVVAAVVNSPGVAYMASHYKLASVSGKNQITGFAFGTELESRFGKLLAGTKYSIVVNVFDSTTGLLSGPMETSGLVVP